MSDLYSRFERALKALVFPNVRVVATKGSQSRFPQVV